MPFQGQIEGFKGSLEPMSIFAVSLGENSESLGILVVNGQQEGPVAKLFKFKVEARTGNGEPYRYSMPEECTDIKNIARLGQTDLQIAVKLHLEPLKPGDLKKAYSALPPSEDEYKYSKPTWKSLHLGLAAFLWRMKFDFQGDPNFRDEDKIAEMVIDFMRDKKHKEAVFPIQTVMDNANPVRKMFKKIRK
ncbi:hypothetical protein DFH11DRAFT_259053 [Phellopilus nigrolimitatus]|nr:hypothetical protein DFH11DRAFT_259053 [Phellopilus nigrolimitatus]